MSGGDPSAHRERPGLRGSRGRAAPDLPPASLSFPRGHPHPGPSRLEVEPPAVSARAAPAGALGEGRARSTRICPRAGSHAPPTPPLPQQQNRDSLNPTGGSTAETAAAGRSARPHGLRGEAARLPARGAGSPRARDTSRPGAARSPATGTSGPPSLAPGARCSGPPPRRRPPRRSLEKRGLRVPATAARGQRDARPATAFPGRGGGPRSLPAAPRLREETLQVSQQRLALLASGGLPHARPANAVFRGSSPAAAGPDPPRAAALPLPAGPGPPRAPRPRVRALFPSRRSALRLSCLCPLRLASELSESGGNSDARPELGGRWRLHVLVACAGARRAQGSGRPRLPAPTGLPSTMSSKTCCVPSGRWVTSAAQHLRRRRRQLTAAARPQCRRPSVRPEAPPPGDRGHSPPVPPSVRPEAPPPGDRGRSPQSRRPSVRPEAPPPGNRGHSPPVPPAVRPEAPPPGDRGHSPQSRRPSVPGPRRQVTAAARPQPRLPSVRPEAPAPGDRGGSPQSRRPSVRPEAPPPGDRGRSPPVPPAVRPSFPGPRRQVTAATLPQSRRPAVPRPRRQVTAATRSSPAGRPSRGPAARPERRSAHAHGAAPRPHRAPAPKAPNAARRAMEPAEVGAVRALPFGRSNAFPP
ncbi:basic salivary proline-rich protein 1-like [Hippopotamus amphibius kiboko]|uniref:basic salivary proline-rich protein 1-like n=1 Tax=Hippopotamus amphibius kiboko TaxID=575201 RepID=UPI002591B90E|nr:basic salivary proline-rich protein 1-like [Hippopotamus amphibius kiboko]